MDSELHPDISKNLHDVLFTKEYGGDKPTFRQTNMREVSLFHFLTDKQKEEMKANHNLFPVRELENLSLHTCATMLRHFMLEEVRTSKPFSLDFPECSPTKWSDSQRKILMSTRNLYADMNSQRWPTLMECQKLLRVGNGFDPSAVQAIHVVQYRKLNNVMTVPDGLHRLWLVASYFEGIE